MAPLPRLIFREWLVEKNGLERICRIESPVSNDVSTSCSGTKLSCGPGQIGATGFQQE